MSNETVTSTSIKTTNANDDDEIVTSVTLVLPSSRTATQFTSSSASVTVNVPAVMSSSTQQQQPLTNATKKTDLDLISVKLSPTKLNATMATAVATDGSGNGGGGGSGVGSTNTKDSLYSMGITDDDKNGKAAAAIHKRSLLDIDNASSLSLADKLRNEANKYSDENAGRENNFGTNKEATCEQQNVDKKTGSPTTPTSPNGLYQSSGVASSTSSISNVNANATPAATSTITTTTTTSLNSHANERRPSWRLKLDAGCKVKTILHKNNQSNKQTNIPKCAASISRVQIQLCDSRTYRHVLCFALTTIQRDPEFFAITQFNTMKNASRLIPF